MPVFGCLALALLHAGSIGLSPTFEGLGLPVYAQSGPWCWAYTTNSVIEYEFARTTGRATSLSTGYLTWAAQETDKMGTGGSNFGRAARGVGTYGVVPLSRAGEPGNEGPPTPTEDAVSLGKKGYQVEFRWLRFWSREPVSDAQFKAIRQELSTGHPVAVGMQWPKKADFYPNTTLLAYPSPEGFQDGHCVVLCGFEDDAHLPGGGRFLFRNSWGANWADHGYASMTYGMLREYLNDAYAIRVAKRQPMPRSPVVIGPTELARDTSGASLQEMKQFGQAWREGVQIFFRPTIKKTRLTIRFAAPKAANYDVYGRFTMAEDYGRYSVSVNGVSSKTIWDGAAAGVSLSEPVLLGRFQLEKGKNEITFSLVGRSAASRGDLFGLYELSLAKRS